MKEITPISDGYAIRDLVEGDMSDCLEIYNEQIRPGEYALWRENVSDLPDRLCWFKDLGDLPKLAAVHEATQKVVGYAVLQTYNGKGGYRRTVELSIYILPEHRKARLGSSLLSRLIPLGKEAGLRVILGLVSDTSVGSQALLKKWGFELKGMLPNVGEKFGKEDLSLMFWYLSLVD